MNNHLFNYAAQACKKVYDDHVDLGTTEYHVSYTTHGHEFVQVLTIAGSNEKADWLINFNLLSWKGIKIGAYKAAKQLHDHFQHIRNPDYKLMVTGHSKAGATAIAYAKLFPVDYCIAFAPARSLRYWTDRKMKNTYLFIDPDDPVHQVGFINFGHPICEQCILPNNHNFLHVMDHHIDNFIAYLEKDDDHGDRNPTTMDRKASLS